jgi:RecA/RadA recombinase
MKQIVVNFFGGPGSGKSTQAAKVFAELKEAGINAELITEYAKDLVYGESFHVMKNQLYIFAKQHHRMWRVSHKVQVIITDSPLPLSLIYGNNGSETFKSLVREEYENYNNYNVFLQRPNSYTAHGRTQTLEQAMDIDVTIKSVMRNNGYHFDIDAPVHENLSKIISGKIITSLQPSGVDVLVK